MLLPEIDEKATIRGCKRKLREYPRWREIAHDSAEQKITQEFTFMPRGGSGRRIRSLDLGEPLC